MNPPATFAAEEIFLAVSSALTRGPIKDASDSGVPVNAVIN